MNNGENFVAFTEFMHEIIHHNFKLYVNYFGYSTYIVDIGFAHS